MAQMTYEQTMAWGAAQYADVLAALGREGLRAEFTQTGGMCAAIVVQLEAGLHLLITDAEDSLSWEPEHRQGWFVGLYNEADTADAVRWEQNDDGDGIDCLLSMVRRVLHPRRAEVG